MSRKRSQVSEQWTLNRCKRIVRPFLSKLHNLSDQCSKDASILGFEVSDKSQHPQPQKGANGSKRSREPEAKRRRRSRRSHTEKSSSDLEIAEYEDFEVEKITYERSYMTPNKLLKPQNAQERLEGLEPYISERLYQAYVDIFASFKSIIVSVELARHQNRFTKLSEICCLEIGKAMVLTSKTSYSRLKNSLLFDPGELPEEIKLYHKHLADDIDHWFELQPRAIFDKYTLDLLVGYLMHLVLFHAQATLYLLVPVLIHWLYEEAIVTNSSNLKQLANTLFHGFWTFDMEKYYDNISTGAITRSMGIMPASNGIFWQLLELGFWDHFISSFGFKSRSDANHYENLVLVSLVCNDKFEDVSSDRLLVVLEKSIYPMIEKNPTNANINSLLVVILARIIAVANEMTHSEEYEDLLAHLGRFTGVWLSFGLDRKMVFNSLYPGNNEIFYGVLKLVRFCHSRTKTPTSARTEAECLYHGLSILRAYFLDTAPSGELEPQTACRSIFGLQSQAFRAMTPFTYSNRDFDDFVYWLIEHKHLALAQQLFQAVYGRYTTFYDQGVDALYCTLFT